MKKAKLYKVIGRDRYLIDEYPILERQDFYEIKRDFYKLGITFKEFSERFCHSIGYIHNIYKNKSDCSKLLKELEIIKNEKQVSIK